MNLLTTSSLLHLFLRFLLSVISKIEAQELKCASLFAMHASESSGILWSRDYF